jgi:hypothetical protein
MGFALMCDFEVAALERIAARRDLCIFFVIFLRLVVFGESDVGGTRIAKM